MIETLHYLTQIQPPRNYKNIASLNKVAEFLYQKFYAIGLQCIEQKYQVDNHYYKNIIGSLNSQYTKRLIIGAHYDVCGDIQGADDNASAVAGVIQTAKKLSEIKDQIPFRIDFVCFTLEEPPYFGTDKMGSFVYAKSLFDEKVDVIGMINYEMIGYFRDEPNSQNYPFPFMNYLYGDVGNFIAFVSNDDSKKLLDIFSFEKNKDVLPSIKLSLPPLVDTITASDHLNFWKFGYEAIMVTDTAHFRNPNYHTENDTLETIDTDKMYQVVDLVLLGIQNLIIINQNK